MPKERSSFGSCTKALETVEGMDLEGKTIMITGSNTGIGLEAARVLAGRKAHIVMACRNETAADTAKQTILKEFPSAKIDIVKFDCGKLKSAEECANAYISKNWPLDVLILNAGAFGPEPRVTSDGFESSFQVNHLTQFYLTKLLMPKLVASAPSRIVAVASVGSQFTDLTPEKMSWKTLSPGADNMTSVMTAYGTSKMCNILFASEVQRRFGSQGVTAYSLHPGVISTNLAHNSWWFSLYYAISRPFQKSVEQGAATTVYCATAPEIKNEGGKYFDSCKVAEPKPQAMMTSEVTAKLWEISEEMIAKWKGQK